MVEKSCKIVSSQRHKIASRLSQRRSFFQYNYLLISSQRISVSLNTLNFLILFFYQCQCSANTSRVKIQNLPSMSITTNVMKSLVISIPALLLLALSCDSYTVLSTQSKAIGWKSVKPVSSSSGLWMSGASESPNSSLNSLKSLFSSKTSTSNVISEHPSVREHITPLNRLHPSSIGQQLQGDELPMHPDVRSGVLDNGFSYVILPNQSPPGRFEAHLQVYSGSGMFCYSKELKIIKI